MESKCPCCGAEMSETYIGWVCMNTSLENPCSFRIAKERLPHIAAAMELARAEAELNTSTRFLFENEAIDDDTPEFSEWITTHRVVMKQHMTAKDRALEVFK